MKYRVRRDVKLEPRNSYTEWPARLSDKVLPARAIIDHVEARYVPKGHFLWLDFEWGRGDYAWFFTQFGLLVLSLEDVEKV